jgi:hypothetical protein
MKDKLDPGGGIDSAIIVEARWDTSKRILDYPVELHRIQPKFRDKEKPKPALRSQETTQNPAL